MKYRVGFIGGGKMAFALMHAMVASGQITADQILCSDIDPGARQKVSDDIGIATTDSNRDVITHCKIVFLAFKPQGFPQTVEPLTDCVRPDQTIVSIMAGIRIAAIKKVLPAQIIRLMPNTPCLTGQMAAGMAVADDVPQADINQVKQLCEGAGIVCEVSEALIDAVTGLSGSGPAFVAYLIDCFIQAGIKEGLPEIVARDLTLQTIAGTANLLQKWDMLPRELIKMVSSPNGTTVAGRSVLENSEISTIISATVAAAAERSRELSRT